MTDKDILELVEYRAFGKEPYEIKAAIDEFHNVAKYAANQETYNKGYLDGFKKAEELQIGAKECLRIIDAIERNTKVLKSLLESSDKQDTLDFYKYGRNMISNMADILESVREIREKRFCECYEEL